MTTIVFTDKELIFDDSLLKGIHLFDSITKHDFGDSKNKMVTLDCTSDTFILLMKYKLMSIDDSKYLEKEMLEMCDYLCLDKVKQNYMDSHSKKYLIDKNIINTKEFIIRLMIENSDALLTVNEFKHIMETLELDVISSKIQFSRNNLVRWGPRKKNLRNIIFFLIYKDYDLIDTAIELKLFEKVDVNKKLQYLFPEYDHCKYDNILTLSCILSNTISSNKIVETLLKIPDIEINSTLITLAKISHTTIETFKMLLERPNVDINFKNDYGFSILHSVLQNQNVILKEQLVKLLLEYPNINVNIQNVDGNTPLQYILNEYEYEDKYNISDEIIKMILEHPNFDVNIQNNKGQTPIKAVLDYSLCGEIDWMVEILLKRPNIDINLQTNRGFLPIDSAMYSMIHCDDEYLEKNYKIIKMLLEKSNIDINLQCKKRMPLILEAIRLIDNKFITSKF